ncbi:MAG: hypothetical protein ACRDA3_13065 [Peptostreptococcaceae bacterium]
MAETKARIKKKKEEVAIEIEVKKPSKKIEDRKTRKSFRELRRLLNRDTEVLVMNNTQGTFYYYCPKTHMSIRLEGFGDTEIVTMEVLEGMKSRGKSIFQNYYLIILDVYPDIDVEDEIEVGDVLTYLGVGDLYTSINNELEKYGETYSDEFFDSLLIDMELNDFRKIVSKMSYGLVRQLATRGHVLFEEGKFDSRNKMSALEEKTGIKDLFATV